MDRRGFLKLFAASTTTYFLPPVKGWLPTPNGILVPSRWKDLTPAIIEADMGNLMLCSVPNLDNIGKLYGIARKPFEKDEFLKERIALSLQFRNPIDPYRKRK